MQTKAFGEMVSSIGFFGLHLRLFVQPSLSSIKQARSEKEGKVTFIVFPQLEKCSCNIAVEQCMNRICIGNNTSEANKSKGCNFDKGVYRGSLWL